MGRRKPARKSKQSSAAVEEASTAVEHQDSDNLNATDHNDSMHDNTRRNSLSSNVTSERQKQEESEDTCEIMSSSSKSTTASTVGAVTHDNQMQTPTSTSKRQERKWDGKDLQEKAPSKNELLTSSHWLTRIVLVRAIAFLYAVAFLVALLQNDSLIGSRGLTPACHYLRTLEQSTGLVHADAFTKFYSAPTVLWFTGCSDQTLRAIPAAGLIISSLILFNGSANFFCMLALWVLYHSVNTVGQRWYGFGWESQLLETGFLAMWLVPLFSLEYIPKESPPRYIIIWAYRWLIMRIMFGAGLIKVRGDQCWRDLTCMMYHYETQPIPNPLSWFYHHSPVFMHRLETLVNHFVELIAPFLLVMPRIWRLVGGAIQVAFQLVLISSGNLSFLNYLTIVPALACFDDMFYTYIFSKSTVERARNAELFWTSNRQSVAKAHQGVLFRLRKYTRLLVSSAIGLLICRMSIPVVENMLSPTQAMNRGFDPLLIVNTYGAFGSLGKTRPEIIIEGTNSSDYLSPASKWIPYEFLCKPGDVSRRPCVISPYHLRMDWLMWFAAMGNYQQYPWLVKLIDNLLNGDETMHSFFVKNPFPEASSPPTAVRASLWEYRFIPPGWDTLPRIMSNGTMFLFEDRAIQLQFPTQWEWPAPGRAYIVDKRSSASPISHTGKELEDMASKSSEYIEIGNYWVRRFLGTYLPPVDQDNDSVKKFLKQVGMKR
eukprot:gb/GECG01009325.1/.p1 GENE.gb/GECG01009325.1/~~gb/GECG01009325.1/.p1  ORF type:complete len:713 (+),score=56.18 gb/GECG01009325.1/:1-2139(+)